MKRLAWLAATCALAVSAAEALHAQDRPQLVTQRTTTPPVLDGVLDDAVWQGAPLTLGDWVSYSPIRGDRTDIRTDVRLAYDDRYLYFAFHCIDSEPDRIRTNVSRRDTAFSDDWVALSLDSSGTGQSAYHLFVNPSGSQMDAINTSASGEQFEADLLWDAVGTRTPDGYIVEVRLPLQSIRFAGGDVVRMGLMFFRKISRTGVSYSWPAMPAGQWVFQNNARIALQNLTPPRLFELLPSVTYGISQERDTRDRWDGADHNAQVGLSVKYGLTSNVTLDATVNPDFSQVESDAFQVEVNQRFPIFYSEKRPFFMEGMGLFGVAGAGGGGNFQTVVHTRRIIDPAFGSKITGTVGKTTFGVLSVSDSAPEDLGDRGDAVLGRNKVFTIARATYALGGADYVGAIVADTEHAGRHNRVQGADLSFKPSPTQSISITWLASQTGVRGSPGIRGTATQVTYAYQTRRVTSVHQVEHVDRDFQMDTAFYKRTGFTSGLSLGEVSFYPNGGSDFWVKAITPNYQARFGHDKVQGGREDDLTTGVRFDFTRQGVLHVARNSGHEPWAGRRFEVGASISVIAGAQVIEWLGLNGSFTRSKQIFYDPADPFSGRSRSGHIGVTLQPNQHFQQDVNYERVRFERADNGQLVYSLHIVNTQTTYQLNRQFRVRLVEQFDSSRRRLLTDLLALYEVRPGTVFHAGYGSLHEKPVGEAGQAVPLSRDGRYTAVRRGLFFKASYGRRF
jgi:hypothetical protein